MACLRRRFSFASQKVLLFRTQHHLYRQGVTLADTQHLRSQGPVPVHAHCTEDRTKFEECEGAIGDGNGVQDENGDGSGDGTGKGTGTGRR